MRVIIRFRAIALGLAITVTACASPPNADVDAAKAALDRAASERAGQYAPESLKAAQDAQAAVDAELKAQEGKWFKSYDRTKELAVATKTAGDKAVADAVAGKERADAIVAKERADCRGQGEGQVGGGPRRGSDQATNQDQGRPAGVPGHCAIGACRRGGHDRSDDWTRRESHGRNGSALDPAARSGRA